MMAYFLLISRTKRVLYLLVILFVCGTQATISSVRAASLTRENNRQAMLTPDQRADQLLAQMTLDEKIALLHGTASFLSSGPSTYAGNIPANPRLGIPALNLEDGAAGVADRMKQVTAFPAPVVGAASWDTNLMNFYGQALGREERGKGVNVVLAPTVNILRVPQWGRSYETFGEDPYLTGQLTAADIQGIQSQGVIATVKHYAANNQESNRNAVSANVDERTLHEIYLPAFQAALQEGHVGAVMCSTNEVNNIYACEQPYLLRQVLKQQWNFPGFVMSDWYATHSTVAAANAGLDMQMPDSSFFGAPLKAAVQNGQVSMDTLNDHVHRILRTMFALGLFDHQPVGSPSDNVATPADALFARQSAEQGTVLLKNDQNILPVNTQQIHSVAVIGPDADSVPKVVGGGSASVIPPYIISPLQGITQRAGNSVTVRHAQGIFPEGGLPTIPAQYFTPPAGSSVSQGLQAQFFANMTLTGTPVLTRTDPNIDFSWNGASPGSGVPATQWSARWTGTLTPPTTGTYTFALSSDDGSRLYINDQLVVNNWSDHLSTTKSATIQLTAGQTYAVRVEYYQNQFISSMRLSWALPGQVDSLLAQAVQQAKSSDISIVLVNDNEAEGADRSDLELPGTQDQLIDAIAHANPHTIVVLNTGGPVLMPWIHEIPGIVEGWYAGQEDGNALAAVLFGDVNPSGKLPMTFPANINDVPANTAIQYPGINLQAQYSEGIFVGYRHYDAQHIKPLFPFGYGLSYTAFTYSNLTMTPTCAASLCNIFVQLDVKNTGSRPGAEVVQLYLGMPSTSKVPEPPRQLKGFQKVLLGAGQTQHLHFSLDSHALAYWDTATHTWIVQNGTYQVMLGSSSRDISLQRSFNIL